MIEGPSSLLSTGEVEQPEDFQTEVKGGKRKRAPPKRDSTRKRGRHEEPKEEVKEKTVKQHRKKQKSRRERKVSTPVGYVPLLPKEHLVVHVPQQSPPLQNASAPAWSAAMIPPASALPLPNATVPCWCPTCMQQMYAIAGAYSAAPSAGSYQGHPGSFPPMFLGSQLGIQSLYSIGPVGENLSSGYNSPTPMAAYLGYSNTSEGLNPSRAESHAQSPAPIPAGATTPPPSSPYPSYPPIQTQTFSNTAPVSLPGPSFPSSTSTLYGIDAITTEFLQEIDDSANFAKPIPPSLDWIRKRYVKKFTEKQCNPAVRFKPYFGVLEAYPLPTKIAKRAIGITTSADMASWTFALPKRTKTGPEGKVPEDKVPEENVPEETEQTPRTSNMQFNIENYVFSSSSTGSESDDQSIDHDAYDPENDQLHFSDEEEEEELLQVAGPSKLPHQNHGSSDDGGELDLSDAAGPSRLPGRIETQPVNSSQTKVDLLSQIINASRLPSSEVESHRTITQPEIAVSSSLPTNEDVQTVEKLIAAIQPKVDLSQVAGPSRPPPNTPSSCETLDVEIPTSLQQYEKGTPDHFRISGPLIPAPSAFYAPIPPLIASKNDLEETPQQQWAPQIDLSQLAGPLSYFPAAFANAVQSLTAVQSQPPPKSEAEQTLENCLAALNRGESIDNPPPPPVKRKRTKGGGKAAKKAKVSEFDEVDSKVTTPKKKGGKRGRPRKADKLKEAELNNETKEAQKAQTNPQRLPTPEARQPSVEAILVKSEGWTVPSYMAGKATVRVALLIPGSTEPLLLPPMAPSRKGKECMYLRLPEPHVAAPSYPWLLEGAKGEEPMQPLLPEEPKPAPQRYRGTITPNGRLEISEMLQQANRPMPDTYANKPFAEIRYSSRNRRSWRFHCNIWPV
ncbi:hypothetical protein HDU97_004761 [Phlyctochytrium planicorne]|nr:hypothetical protein HDU97_004761 [Phlyctochytrium planicorne]